MRTASAYFNQALEHKKLGDYDAAEQCYRKALSLDISDPHEVLLNLGVLYSDRFLPTKALSMYERALAIVPDYIPALFNMAGIKEEMGERHAAVDTYERILRLDPQHFSSLVRLANASKVNAADDPLLDRLRLAIECASQDPLGQEGLYFALGKAFDELEQFELAFDAYRKANALGKERCPPYNPIVTERAFEEIINLFDARWIGKHRTDSTAEPIFICGLFRSGSTLIEHVLSAHPEIAAAGELHRLPYLIGRTLAPYPNGAANAPAELLRRVSDDYMAHVKRLFPGARWVTDKRLDNFLHLGLIRALFPNAKIIHTRRNAQDNGLSIYFQQLDGSVNYATGLKAIAHYRAQHDRLMRHWARCLDGEMFTLDYDEFVKSPELTLRELVNHIGVGWDDVLMSQKRSNQQVRTASLWQVREPIHQGSTGRWQNYEQIIARLCPQ